MTIWVVEWKVSRRGRKVWEPKRVYLDNATAQRALRRAERSARGARRLRPYHYADRPLVHEYCDRCTLPTHNDPLQICTRCAADMPSLGDNDAAHIEARSLYHLVAGNVVVRDGDKDLVLDFLRRFGWDFS